MAADEVICCKRRCVGGVKVFSNSCWKESRFTIDVQSQPQPSTAERYQYSKKLVMGDGRSTSKFSDSISDEGRTKAGCEYKIQNTVQ